MAPAARATGAIGVTVAGLEGLADVAVLAAGFEAIAFCEAVRACAAGAEPEGGGTAAGEPVETASVAASFAGAGAAAAAATVGALAGDDDVAGESVAIAREVSAVVAGGALPLGLASGVAAEGFAAPSKGSSVSVRSAGVASFAPLPDSLSRAGVAAGSPVSSCALRSSSGSMRSVVPGALEAAGAGAMPFWSEAASCAAGVDTLAAPSTNVGGVIPSSTSGSINSSPAALGALATSAGRASVGTGPSPEGAGAELSRAGRTGRPPSRGSSIGRSVRGSSIKRDAASTGSCLVARYPATPGRQYLPDGSQIEVPHSRRVIEVSFDITGHCARGAAGYLNAQSPDPIRQNH